MDKKYEIIKSCKLNINGKTLYAIRACRTFGDVKANTMGGWVESEESLSHNDDCWVYDNAMVFSPAIVTGNATIRNNAVILGDSVITDYATVADNAIVENATVSGKAKISHNVEIHGIDNSITITDYAVLRDNVDIRYTSNIIIRDHARICDYVGFRPEKRGEVNENTTIIGGGSSISGKSCIFGGTICGDCTIIDCVIEGTPNINGNTFLKNIKVKGNACIFSSRIANPNIVIGEDAYILNSREFLFITLFDGYGVTFYKTHAGTIRMQYSGRSYSFNALTDNLSKINEVHRPLLIEYWNMADKVLGKGVQQIIPCTEE